MPRVDFTSPWICQHKEEGHEVSGEAVSIHRLYQKPRYLVPKAVIDFLLGA